MPTHEQSLAPSAQGRSSCSVVRKQLTHIGSGAEKSFFTELYKATGPPGGFREPIHPICMHAKQRGIAQRLQKLSNDCDEEGDHTEAHNENEGKEEQAGDENEGKQMRRDMGGSGCYLTFTFQCKTTATPPVCFAHPK